MGKHPGMPSKTGGSWEVSRGNSVGETREVSRALLGTR